jgi:hypothetical protein
LTSNILRYLIGWTARGQNVIGEVSFHFKIADEM